MVTKQQTRKDHSVPAIFIIYSIFSNRNQKSLFSYDKFITMAGEKKGGVPMLVGGLMVFQLTELNIKANLPCFQYACARERVTP